MKKVKLVLIGAGDRGIIRSFCQMLTGTYTGNYITDVNTSIDNHLATFAAEKSRLTNTVIDILENFFVFSSVYSKGIISNFNCCGSPFIFVYSDAIFEVL